MAEYIQKAEDNYFTDLIGDETFGNDLKKFFTGGRYNYSQKEIEEKGVEGLANDFVEHMRFQSTNETTAVKDLLYVQRDFETNEKVSGSKSRDRQFKEGKKAFGRLMQAYDMSAGGGDGSLASKLEGAGDYLRAFASSPSTIATAATLGTGIFSKIAAKGASKGAQMSLRAHMSKLLSEGIKEAAVKEKFKKTFTAGAAKGAGISFAIEAPPATTSAPLSA